jgi:hypothetical protein
MKALVSPNRSSLSIVTVSFLILLFLVLLVAPSSAGFNGATKQTASTIVSSKVVTEKNNEYAGYELYSLKAGSKLVVQATWNIPTVNCTQSDQYFVLNVQIAHYSSLDVGSQLYVVCVGAGMAADYSVNYAVDGGWSGVSKPVYPGDVMKTSASENPMTGATYVSIEDTTSGHSWSISQDGKELLNPNYGGLISWFMYTTPSSSSPVPAFTAIKFSGVKATADGHTGKLGSFLSIKGFTVYEEILFISADKHVLVNPTSMGSASTSFKLKWVEGF